MTLYEGLTIYPFFMTVYGSLSSIPLWLYINIIPSYDLIWGLSLHCPRVHHHTIHQVGSTPHSLIFHLPLVVCYLPPLLTSWPSPTFYVRHHPGVGHIRLYEQSHSHLAFWCMWKKTMLSLYKALNGNPLPACILLLVLISDTFFLTIRCLCKGVHITVELRFSTKQVVQ